MDVLLPYRTSFFRRVVKDLLESRVLRTDMRVLVTCAGRADRDVLAEAGFSGVTLSNIDGLQPDEIEPFTFSRQDAEQLEFADGSFDFAIVQNGLHHCGSPHRALTELYRVARKGVLVLDAYESVLTRVGVRLGFGQEYECHAVGTGQGGLNNTVVPNHVYRWTEREIRKTVRSYAPYGRHGYIFFRRLLAHWGVLKGRGVRYWIVRAAYPALRLLNVCFPRQTSNHFGVAILKPDLPGELFPWLRMADGKIVAGEPRPGGTNRS